MRPCLNKTTHIEHLSRANHEWLYGPPFSEPLRTFAQRKTNDQVSQEKICLLGTDWLQRVEQEGRGAQRTSGKPHSAKLGLLCGSGDPIFSSTVRPTGLRTWAFSLGPRDSPWGQHPVTLAQERACPSPTISGAFTEPAIHGPYLSGIYFGSALVESEVW